MNCPPLVNNSVEKACFFRVIINPKREKAQARLLDQELLKSLIQSIETGSLGLTQLDDTLRSLVCELQKILPLNISQPSGELGKSYPVDEEGYARSYCPLTQPDEFMSVWQHYGIVVGKQILGPLDCRKVLERIHGLLGLLDKGTRCDLQGVPVISRGFFEIYHDTSLANIRQSLRFYLHHVLIWQRADLWCSFDRFGIKPPEGESAAGLPLHVDQNPLVHPEFRTTQGVLALVDCPIERGTFMAVPGSRAHFPIYADMAKNRGEYVELDLSHPAAPDLCQTMQPLALRAGDLVTWDSRTTHGNTPNISNQTRYVAYVSAGPARPNDNEAVKARQDAFANGLGSNVRDALMHASKKPRFTDPDLIAKLREKEQLNLLGRYLYGQESYPPSA